MSVSHLLDDLRNGNRRALARAITQVENRAAPDLLNALFPYTGNAYLIGITGAPGTGKSTLVNALTKYIRTQNKTVGIIAVDPTSPFSGGAVLGDRIRMQDLVGDSGIFIRSMASRGQLGGLAQTTADVVRVMDAAGFDYIIIETVGAGQNEVTIATLAYTVIVVDAPGLGDDIQAIKAGTLEIADILVVNKADRPGADNTVRVLKTMLTLGHRQQYVAHHGRMMLHPAESAEIDTWEVPVLKTVASESKGVEELLSAIHHHHEHLQSTGQHEKRERQRLESELLDRLQHTLLEQFLEEKVTPDQMNRLLAQMLARELAPAQAAHELINA
ncbi:MAG: methylmalonyl Co-A mutase-associated GTPase MeaB [Anaerolineae bacterium]|nr:methylmalonyl Co-A mutase-associated GTPase MeaB [Anaerolineae bacterium]